MFGFCPNVSEKTSVDFLCFGEGIGWDGIIRCWAGASFSSESARALFFLYIYDGNIFFPSLRFKPARRFKMLTLLLSLKVPPTID